VNIQSEDEESDGCERVPWEISDMRPGRARPLPTLFLKTTPGAAMIKKLACTVAVMCGLYVAVCASNGRVNPGDQKQPAPTFKETDFLAKIFKQYDVNLDDMGENNKGYSDIACQYNWCLDDDKFITIGKAAKILLKTQGQSFSEEESVLLLRKAGCLPRDSQARDFVELDDMKLLLNYVNDNKPLKIFKPVITEQAGAKAVNEYRSLGYTHRTDMGYEPFCDFLYWGRDYFSNYTADNATVKLDENGIPMSVYGPKFHYNPVTVAQYALSLYGRILLGYKSRDQFIRACEKLISMQDSSGAFRFYFDYPGPAGITYASGWVSSLAQAHALSVFSRAYKLTNNNKYLKAGNLALFYMTIPVGGVQGILKGFSPDLDKYIFFEEYPSNPNLYTLNGFVLTILGLYDWWLLNPVEKSGNHAIAKEYFTKCMITLRYMLPMYDAGGYSVYDLSHITFNSSPAVNVGYHKLHIELLAAIYSITKDEWINYYKKLWMSYVD
jgi:hypothetical protein